ncbi:MAG TPA: hypothetical protein VMH48_06955 [Methylomirabilota bacterium]|nr:hypothetical protein [Methylomirabilota bacterium]
MNDSGGNFADDTIEAAVESVASANTELRKRRSTRIVQAVPLVVTGVDALGRPFVERTSSLIINCHGCRYQSKHYVLKNMWVTLEIPHPETGQPPRSVRGRVAWIQRPRTVRQLFQVALELEVSGNVWGIAFPPEDWFTFPAEMPAAPKLEPAAEHAQLPQPAHETELALPAEEAEHAPSPAADNLRVFPSPTSTTDASLQLARQVARLVADAKQQIQAAAREAASHAVSAERRLSFEQWEQKFAAGRAEIANETAHAIERLQQETEEQSRVAHAAAAEALRTELPRWLAPQLEQLTRDLTGHLLQQASSQRAEHAQQTETAAQSLNSVVQQAEETAARLRTQAEQSESQMSTRADNAVRALEETARQKEEAAVAQREALRAAAAEIQQQTAVVLTAAQSSWQEQVTKEREAAQERWRQTLESTLAQAQERAVGGLSEHVRALFAEVQEELARQVAALRESAGAATAESEQRLTALRSALQEHSKELESVLARAAQTSEQFDQHSEQLRRTQQHALGRFQSELDDVLSLHRNQLHRESESVFESINERIHKTFEEAANLALEQFDRQIEEMVTPHISRTEEAIHRLAGGRSLLDAALTLQQDRIRNSADAAFAESLAHFRENLGGVEQILQESSQTITGRSLTDLESKVGDLKHQVIEELLKSAEWYEKKAQTQIQNQSEKAVEQTVNQLREKAGEISGAFAAELNHSSRSFVGHTQTQMEEVVRDSFERARALFAEAADTTAAAFTDEIQRTGRQELDGFNQELARSTGQVTTELALRLTAEQEAFLNRFHSALGCALEAGVAEAQKKVSEGFTPLLAQWKSMTDAHQHEVRATYQQMGEQAAEQHKHRLEAVSNQWMLATVASLDHQSREMISGIAATAEEKLREACAQVFAGVGESLRERLAEIAKSFTISPEAPPRAKSAKTSS